MKKHFFNMIEILLALGVIAIGICSVMVLFPVGSAASRDSAMETYASNAADQILHTIHYNLNKDNGSLWKTFIYNDGNPTASTTMQEDFAAANTATAIFQDFEDAAKWDFSNDLIKGTDLQGGIFSYATNKNFFQIVIHRDTQSKALKDIAEDKIDFRAIAQIRKNKIQLDPMDDNTKLNYAYGTRLDLKISWPAELPENAQQSATYTLEIFRNK